MKSSTRMFLDAMASTADTVFMDSAFVWQAVQGVLILTEVDHTPTWGGCTGGLEP